jgi:hypothetical protein
MKLTVMVALFGLLTFMGKAQTGLFFSEYVEGTSSEKYLEIYNGTGTAINFTTTPVRVTLFANGAIVPTSSFNLTGTLSAGGVVVLRAPSAVLYPSALPATPCNFNGDDALVLLNSSNDTLDIFGKFGCDPGTLWRAGTMETAEFTLIRQPNICSGVTTNLSACGVSAFPTFATQWIQKNQDDVSNLGTHYAACGQPNIGHRFFRSRQNGAWDDFNTWESATTLAGPYTNASIYPTYSNSDFVTISNGTIVLDTATTLPLGQIQVLGELRLGKRAAIDLYAELGIDFDIQGTFVDSSSNALNFGVNFQASPTWRFGPNTNYYKLRGSSSGLVASFYDGPATAMPATANWYLRTIDATDRPSFSPNMVYPNLIFENTTGTVWNMTFNTFNANNTDIKGNLSLCYPSTSTNDGVTFIQNAATPTSNQQMLEVQGNMFIGMYSVFRNILISSGIVGGGLDLKGNLTVEAGGGIDIRSNAFDRMNSRLSFSGTANQTISANATLQIQNLEINKPDNALIVTSGSTLNVFDSLYLTKGIFSIATPSFLTLKDTTVVSSPASNYTTCCGIANIGWERGFVNGAVRKEINTTTAHFLPIGKIKGADTLFAPVRLDKLNTVANTYTAEYFFDKYPDLNFEPQHFNKISDIEYWQISAADVNNDDARLTLSWRPTSKIGDGIPANDAEAIDSLVVGHYFDAGAGAKWNIHGFVDRTNPSFSKIGNVNYGYITTGNYITSFSPFTLGGKSPFNILPFNNLMLNGTPSAYSNTINWSTSWEQNLTAYELQFSTDGIGFHAIANNAAKNQTNNQYVYTHVLPTNYSVGFYRLKITAQNGAVMYSNTIKLAKNRVEQWVIAPNPVQSFINIPVNLEAEAKLIQIIDMYGKVVFTQVNPSGVVWVQQLASGIYQANLYTKEGVIKAKFFKQ